MNLLHAWLVYDRQGAKRNASYIEMHKTIGHSMGIEFHSGRSVTYTKAGFCTDPHYLPGTLQTVRIK